VTNAPASPAPATPWRTARVIQALDGVIPLAEFERLDLFRDHRARLAHVTAAEASYRAREAARTREHERTVAVWNEAVTAAALRGEDAPEPPAPFVAGPGVRAFEDARAQVLDEVRATWAEHGARVVAEQIAVLDDEGEADDAEANRLRGELRTVEARQTARSTRRDALRRAADRLGPAPTPAPVIDDRRLNVIQHNPEDAPRHGPLADLVRDARDAASGVRRGSGLFRAR
jgi:hypothetical protein